MSEIETLQLRLNEANAFATEAARMIDDLHERLQRTMAVRDQLRTALVELEAAMPSAYEGIWRRTIRDALAGGGDDAISNDSRF